MIRFLVLQCLFFSVACGEKNHSPHTLPGDTSAAQENTVNTAASTKNEPGIETASMDALDEFRLALADPETHPIRAGMKLDVEAMKNAVEKFRTQNSDLFADRFVAILEKLPAGEMPTSPSYRKVCAADDQRLFGGDAGRLYFAYDPDAVKLAHRAMSTSLPRRRMDCDFDGMVAARVRGLITTGRCPPRNRGDT